jgi:hypothetical protein
MARPPFLTFPFVAAMAHGWTVVVFEFVAMCYTNTTRSFQTDTEVTKTCGKLAQSFPIKGLVNNNHTNFAHM